MDEVLGGVIGASSGLCANIDWSKVDPEEKKKTPVMLYHGKNDNMIPLSFAAKSYRVMKDHGIDHMDWTAEDGLAHSLSMTEIKKITKFFTTHMQN